MANPFIRDTQNPIPFIYRRLLILMVVLVSMERLAQLFIRYLGSDEWLPAPRLYVVAEAVARLGVGWRVRSL